MDCTLYQPCYWVKHYDQMKRIINNWWGLFRRAKQDMRAKRVVDDIDTTLIAALAMILSDAWYILGDRSTAVLESPANSNARAAKEREYRFCQAISTKNAYLHKTIIDLLAILDAIDANADAIKSATEHFITNGGDGLYLPDARETLSALNQLLVRISIGKTDN